MPPEPRAASSRLKRKNAVRENGVIHMAGPAGFPRPTGALPLGCFAPAGESLKTSHWLVFLTGFHLIGSNPLRTETQQKTARRRFCSQICGWASRIRTYITGTKNQGPAIGRWPSVVPYGRFGIISYFSCKAKPARASPKQRSEPFGKMQSGTSAQTAIRVAADSHSPTVSSSPGSYRARSSQNATALAAATFNESTPWAMGIFTV